MHKSQYELMYGLEDEHWWFLAKRKFIEAVLPKAGKRFRILDIGSGTGGASVFLKQWGKVTGIEVSKHAFGYLKKRGIKYIPVSISNYNIPKKTFDAVFLLDVLYHRNIVNDQKVLNKIYKSLDSGGIVCITDCALLQFYSHHDVVVEARTRYSLAELVKKVERAGFTVSKSSYTYFFVFPAFVMQRLLNKFIPFAAVSRISPKINMVLLWTCSFEAFLLRFMNFPIGSSVIILAKKQ